MNLTYAIGSGQGWAADWEPYGNSRERSEALVRQAFAELERETRSTFKLANNFEPDVWVTWQRGKHPWLQLEGKENRGVFWPRGWKIPNYGVNPFGKKGLIVFNEDRKLGFDLDWKRYGASPPAEWDGPICADAWHPYQRRAIGAVWHELGHLWWPHSGPVTHIASGNFTASYFHLDEYPRVHGRLGKPTNWRPLELVQWGDALRDIRALWMNEHRTTSATEVREKRNRLAELRAATPNPDHRFEIHAAIVRMNEQLRAYQTAAVNWHKVNKEWRS